MATIALVGATSTLAGHIAKRLRENGHTLRLLSATGASEPTDAELVVVGDTPTCSACVQHLHGVDVVVLVATPSRRTWVDAAVTAACPLVDCASEQHDVAAIMHSLKALPAVLGAGLMPGIADLLVNLTRSRFQPSVTKISTAYTLPDRNFPPSSFQGSAGRRRAVAQTLTHAGIRIANARAVAEPIGERRTPVWFPRPVGPQYGLGWPSVSALTLPAQIPGLESYENYVVVGNWRTEAAQALSNLAQRDRGARWLHQRAEKPSRRTEATGLRWACVAEMRGGGTFRRAWAYGKDPYAVSAAMAVVAVGALLRGEVYARASMAMLSDAEQILDDLTATTGLRFSVSDPMEDRPL